MTMVVVDTLDASGNVIAQVFTGDDGEPPIQYVFEYDFDSKGNWTVERMYEVTAVKKKRTLKLEGTTYRTIEYYP